MLELILGVLLAAGATYYVLLPILRPPAPMPASGAVPADEGEDPDDDMRPQTVALRALKEIEFDRATGKLSDADYDALKAKYTEEALAALRREGSLTPGGSPGSPGISKPRAAARGQSTKPPACPSDGPRPEPDAVFCSACGRRLGTALAYCSRCGTALEKDARYCDRCGSRVAA
jgi:hypothetical protein